MMQVRDAVYRGIVDSNGHKLAEVAVRTDEPGDPAYLAYFRKGLKGYQLVRVMADRSDRELDWFDNNLHAAYEDVTAALFTGPSHMAENDRDEFARQVLGVGEVRQKLDAHFEAGGR